MCVYIYLDNLKNITLLITSAEIFHNPSQIRRGGNTVAHVLAQFPRNLVEDVIWIEDSPPPALAALFHDVSFL